MEWTPGVSKSVNPANYIGSTWISTCMSEHPDASVWMCLGLPDRDDNLSVVHVRFTTLILIVTFCAAACQLPRPFERWHAGAWAGGAQQMLDGRLSDLPAIAGGRSERFQGTGHPPGILHQAFVLHAPIFAHERVSWVVTKMGRNLEALWAPRGPPRHLASLPPGVR